MYHLYKPYETMYLEKANLFVEEVSSGVYYVKKDRFKETKNEFITSAKLVELLNQMEKVVIKKADKELVSNTNYGWDY